VNISFCSLGEASAGRIKETETLLINFVPLLLFLAIVSGRMQEKTTSRRIVHKKEKLQTK
jgi:predicted branched-subunit amino acid permease